MTEKLVFTPREEDLRAAYGLHLKQTGWKRIGYFIIFGVAVGIVLAALEGFEDDAQTVGVIAGMALWAGTVALLIKIFIPIWWVPRLSKKIFKQQKDLRLETTTWWDDEKLYSGNEQGHSNFAFADMVKWRANDKVVLLYRSDHLFNFLPAHIFKNKSHRDSLIRRLEDAGVSGKTEE